ncbi:MAG TPA: protein kinase, partial [Candidatus Acidoferrales bacterium]|nr:protein kinase [Candidatus Acidoferrales bacterium]
NHSSIAVIYGFEDSGNIHALVMELVEGPTLAERIKAGAIPIDEALPIAKQICEGLEYAHERGIIHRDLKPSNVKVTRDGQVKILDFGLAKAIEGDPSATSVENSPTLSAMATHAGFLLGTAAYMSPEQARGKAADRRADIWALGVVLYEMLSGQRLFTGDTTSDTLAAVIRAEPDWNALPANTPPAIGNLLRRCLNKDPRQRLQSIGDARIIIDESLSGAPQDASLFAAGAIHTPVWRRALPWALAAAASAIAVLLAISDYTKTPNSPHATVSEIPASADEIFTFVGYGGGSPVLSPDGQRLAYAAMSKEGQQHIWLRRLDASVAQPLLGTEGGEMPFWAPDSRNLGYFAKGKLYRIDSTGGPPIVLCEAGDPIGGTWGSDGDILFSRLASGQIYRTSASGGAPQPVTKPNEPFGQANDRWPQFLPDGDHFLFYVGPPSAENRGIYVASLAGGEPKLLLRNDWNAIYSVAGYLLFVREGTLMAQRFDPAKLQLTGDAMPVTEHVQADAATGRGIVSASQNGYLVYEGGNATSGKNQLLWFDRAGKQIAETGEPGDYATTSLSPDGTKLAVATLGSIGIWTYDIARGTKTRLTFSAAVSGQPSWSPDGKFIAFFSDRKGQPHLYEKAADGTGTTSPLLEDDAMEFYPFYSFDGRYLIFERGMAKPNSHMEIWAMSLSGDRKPFPVIQSEFDLSWAALSPDGKWLAYVSPESGRTEIYVVPFLHGSGKWLISTNGGTRPRWRGDGKELFYLSLDNKIMSAEIAETESSLSVGKVQALFQANPSPNPGWLYNASPDGKRFLVVTQGPAGTAAPLTLVVNWLALLKKQ